MAQDEKMLVPVEPTDTMIEAAVDAFPRSHPSVFPIIYRAMLSAAPAQPAAVEGAEWLTDEDHAVIKRCVERQPKLYMRGQHEGYYVHSDIADLIDMIGRAQPAALDEGAAGEPVGHIRGVDDVLVVDWAQNVMPPAGTALYAHPSPTPAADDALRVAVEALEDAAHEAHGRGYVQGFADAVWDETGDYDEKALTENLDPEKLRDGWYDDARHTYRDAQTEALAALKAGGVK